MQNWCRLLPAKTRRAQNHWLRTFAGADRWPRRPRRTRNLAGRLGSVGGRPGKAAIGSQEPIEKTCFFMVFRQPKFCFCVKQQSLFFVFPRVLRVFGFVAGQLPRNLSKALGFLCKTHSKLVCFNKNTPLPDFC